MSGTITMTSEEYDALHAEAEALESQRAEQWQLRRDAEARCDTQAAVIAQMKEDAEALRAENRRLKRTVEEGMPRLMQQGYEMRAELEAAQRGIREAVELIDCISRHPANRIPALDQARAALVKALTATPAPEVQAETLDDRLKQAGMLSVAELLKGAPLDAFIKHAGVHDLATLLQWAEMRRGECLRMMARYDLGEKDKGDDLYEWTVAHCAAFTELHVNLRAALAEQGERQEAVGWLIDWPDNPGLGLYFSSVPDANARSRPLYTTPQPGPDVRGLVEALEGVVKRCSRSVYVGVDGQYLKVINAALAAHRQAQQGGSHDT